jgi:hypothetical protein
MDKVAAALAAPMPPGSAKAEATLPPVLNVGLTDLVGSVLQSGSSQPMPAMKPFFLSQRPILPVGAAFWPETAVFRVETAPPFGAGAALDAPGAEFRPTGTSLGVAGAEFRRPGALLAVAGVALRHLGAAPISKTEAPAAWSAASMTRSGQPAPRSGATFQGSAETPLRIADPADKSVRAPLGAALCPQLFALCFT